MMTAVKLTMTFVLTVAALGACNGDGDGTGNSADAAPLPSDASDGCEPATVLPTQWRPIAMVSAGALNVSTANGVTSGTIDATAGGTSAAADSPYIYLNLVDNSKVALTDTAALSSTTWHLALKRASIKLNGGDSGPGMVSAASVSAVSLAAVTTVPGTMATDDWADASCQLLAGPTGEPASVMSTWYDYDTQSHVLTPREEVWVLQLEPDVYRKLRIKTYYGAPGQPMRGGYYEVEWADL